MGALGLGYEIILQGGSRPEVMTAMISLIATAGALKVDEARKNGPPPPPSPAATDAPPKEGARHVWIDSEGRILDEEG